MKPNREAEFNDRIKDLAERAKINSWTEFVEELAVPSELYPALQTGRTELIKLLKPRALTEQECADLYKLIGSLLATNMALRDHAEELAQLVHNWTGAFQTLDSVGRKIGKFAQFRHNELATEGEDDRG